MTLLICPILASSIFSNPLITPKNKAKASTSISSTDNTENEGFYLLKKSDFVVLNLNKQPSTDYLLHRC